jgi:hypothetical protein
MSSILLRTQNWPLVITTVTGDLDEPKLRRYLDEFTSTVLGRGQLFASVVDARSVAAAPSARLRKIVSDWELAHGSVGKRWNAGIAIVTTSALVRGAMTAIHWISPPLVPTTYEAKLESAIAWAWARLKERGVAVTPNAGMGPAL